MARAGKPVGIPGKATVMSIVRLLRWLVALAVALFVLNLLHISPASLWRAGKERLADFKNETTDLASGKAVEQVSQRARAEMRAAQAANPASDQEMRELQAERARVIEAKFNALQNQKLSPTEQSKLSEQVLKSAQQAAGGN
jgi:ABC-type transport system involved in cytochrome bd biosynthesis fused ATPase/permease subunit